MKKKLLLPLLFIFLFNFTYSQIVANTPSFYTICEQNTDGYASFDLESKTAEVLGSQSPTDLAVTYHESFNDALTGINALASPYTNIIPNQQIFVRVTDVSNSNNFDTTDFYINTGEIPTVGTPIVNEICDDDSDGIAVFNLSQNDAWFAGDPNIFDTRYYLTQVDADSNTNAIINTTSFANLTNPQTLFVRVEDPPTLCHEFSTLTLYVLPSPTSSQPNAIGVCDDDGAEDGFYAFDLTINEAQIINGESNITLSYYQSQADAESGTNSIVNPTNYVNTLPNSQIIFVRVEDLVTGCYTVVDFNLYVIQMAIANVPNDLIVCDNGGNGFAEFNLINNDAEILGSQDPASFDVNYYVTQADAAAGMNPLVSPYTNTTNPQTIYASVNSIAGNCTSNIVSFNLIVNELNISTSSYDMFSCGFGNGVGYFDLTQNESQITNGDTSLIVSYFQDLNDAFNNINALNDPSYFENVNSPYFQTIFIRVDNPNNGCFYVNSNTVINLNAYDLQVVEPTPLVADDPDNDGFTPFNLTDKDAEITGGNGYVVTYHETLADVYNDVNPLTSPYINIVANMQTVYVRVEDPNQECTTSLELVLITEYSPFQINDAVLELCGTSANGAEVFDLTAAESQILGALNASEYTIAYYYSQTDANSQTNAISNVTNYSNTSNPETIFVGVTQTATNDYVTTTLVLITNELPIVDFDGNLSICDGNAIVLNPNTNQPNYTYQWNTGESTPTITTNIGGFYEVTVINPATGCSNTGSITVTDVQTPMVGTPQDIVLCGANSVFDLTTTVTEIANGIDPSTLSIAFYETQADAASGSNPIQNPNVYTALSSPQTIFVAIYNTTQSTCAAFVSFNLITENCPVSVDCAQPIMHSFCYTNNETAQYTYTSIDGSPLQITINSGQVENNFDGLIVLDTDGTTNLNAATPYGNGGDISNLTFASSGDSITIYVDSDGSISCQVSNYNSIDYVVSCVDVNAVPSCTSLVTPQDGATNVNENVVLTWSAATGIVDGYKISIGTTSGGTDIANAIDVGNVLSYSPVPLSSLTDYYVTIIPFNVNGDAVGCNEQIFTTREIPSSPVGVTCASDSPTYIFTEDFETDAPSGWSGTGFSGNNGNWGITAGNDNSSETGPFSSFNGNSHLEYEASGNSSTIASVITPDIDLTAANSGVELSFYMHAYGVDVGTLNINVNNIGTGTTDTVFTWTGEYQETDTDPWLPIGVNLDAYIGSVISIELSYGGTGNGFRGDLSIDYLRVQTCGSFCIAPSDITVTNITDTTADVSWTSNGNETEWQYVVQSAGTGEPTSGWMSTSTSALSLTGLIALTDYEVYIRSNCGADGLSLWSLRDFTTQQQTNFTVDCSTNQPVNNSFCYENSETLQYTYTSTDGSPLYIVFNSGNTENNFDELIVLDSDGVTNLNTDNPYGNSGDLSGLTFNTTGDTVTIYIQSDGSVIGCTNNPIDFDVFCGTNIGLIEVNAFLDENNDGIFNGNDVPFTNGFFTYEVNNDGNVNIVSTNTGSFTIANQDETNSYDITFTTNTGYETCFNIPTALFENITVLNGNTITVDFPVTEQMPCEDLAVYLVPFSSPRPGFNYWNDLVIENLGATTIASGTVTFIHDPIVTYVDATPFGAGLTVTQTATGATVDFTNLQPGETRTVWFRLYTPPTVPLGEFVTSSVAYTTAANDIISDNNVSVITQEVIGSYDPNDITESHGRDIIYNDFITTDEYLYYTIRFQNVGTAEAINVRIENTVNALLDMSTMQMLRSSHDYVMMQNGNQLTWTFDNINLPAQSQDDFGSNGYVYFKIKPTPGYNIGTIIPNTAEIYFDFNAPVVTNTFETEFVVESLSIEEFANNDFIIYPNPANTILNIKLKNIVSEAILVEVIDVQGKVIIQNAINETLQVNIKNLEAGLYFVKLKSNNKQVIKKLIIE